jgi:hypothetical protein
VSEGDPPPPGCTGDSTETHRFVASAGLAAKPGARPIASYGRLRFRVLLTSPTATSTTETAGSWEPDALFPPDDPSVCTFKPETKTGPCRFAPDATRASGAEFALLPMKGTYELYYNRNAAMVSCEDEAVDASLLSLVATKLRVSAVKRLGRGRSASVSGSVVTPPLNPSASGGETLHYTLRVERVR